MVITNVKLELAHMDFKLNMGKFFFVSLLFGVICLFSCTSNKRGMESEISKVQVDESSNKKMMLNLDTLVMGSISGYTVDEGGEIFLTDGRTIAKLDKEGRLIKSINRQGEGPDEYISLGNLSLANGFLYAWDPMELKLLQFDQNLNFIIKKDGPGTAIRDFMVMPSGDVYYYLSGSKEHLIAKCYENFPDSIRYAGDVSNEDKALLLYTYSKCLGTLNGEVFFSPPSKMHLMDFEGKRETISLCDKDFKVTEIDDFQSLKNDRNRHFEYINQNSVVTGLAEGRERCYLLTETGNVIIEQGKADTSNRMVNILVFNKKGNVAGGIQFKLQVGNYKMIGDKLYSLVMTEDESLYITILDVDKILL